MTYTASNDTYLINDQKIKGWEKFAFNSQKFFRKEESDWNMVYLARTEGSIEEAEIEWKFDLPDKPIKELKIKVTSETYENAKVFWVRNLI